MPQGLPWQNSVARGLAERLRALPMATVWGDEHYLADASDGGVGEQSMVVNSDGQ